MAVLVEASFMNELPFSLREAAQELYVKESLDSLVDMRLKDVSSFYRNAFSLKPNQWLVVLDAVILTQLSQFTLGKHLGSNCVSQMIYLVGLVLGENGVTSKDVTEYLEEHAQVFSVWYSKLLKLNSKH
ncbi:hypothetical protein [Thiomicrorhabdus lithotrophica]|uniref:Uncharacterized protein n=1 Tax=Thiomicrorhabdus lithotrophica TaxID=2949997 RepID=A0ABY8CFZ5_9GAMM|nr:hypothetical protein [Thiomicrorhabdus lithotrophica]WEJ63630.1 hypothetical protein NR989_05080 [Thiomicrorhabdus lithotrophica]